MLILVQISALRMDGSLPDYPPPAEGSPRTQDGARSCFVPVLHHGRCSSWGWSSSARVQAKNESDRFQASRAGETGRPRRIGTFLLTDPKNRAGRLSSFPVGAAPIFKPRRSDREQSADALSTVDREDGLGEERRRR